MGCTARLFVMEDGKKVIPLLLTGILGLRLTETGDSFMFGVRRKNDRVKPLKQPESVPMAKLFEEHVGNIDSGQRGNTRKHGEKAEQLDNSQVQPDSAYFDHTTIMEAIVHCKDIIRETEGKTVTQNSPFRRFGQRVASNKVVKLFRKEEAPEPVSRFTEYVSPTKDMVKSCIKVDGDQQPDPVLSANPTKDQKESRVKTEADAPADYLFSGSFQARQPLAQSTPLPTENRPQRAKADVHTHTTKADVHENSLAGGLLRMRPPLAQSTPLPTENRPQRAEADVHTHITKADVHENSRPGGLLKMHPPLAQSTPLPTENRPQRPEADVHTHTRKADVHAYTTRANVHDNSLSRGLLKMRPPLAQSTPLPTENGQQRSFQYPVGEHTLANMEADIPFTNKPNLPAEPPSVEDRRLAYHQKTNVVLDDTGFQTASPSELKSDPESPVSKLTTKFSKTKDKAKPAYRKVADEKGLKLKIRM